jgi:hypothetical protein
MSANKHILVGFGGSGLAALATFAKWVAQDYKIRLQAKEDYAFILCDTDKVDIENTQSEIHKILPDVITKTIQLGREYGDRKFHQFANDKLKNHAGNSRVMDSWWYNSDQTPFIASNLEYSIENGAGQCPAVSNFLAWTSTKISEEIRNIKAELQHKSIGSDPQNMQVSSYLIAGLAGGTGRGCWAPLGMQMAQALEGLETKPTGFFFDATCFEGKTKSDQFVKLQTNSLTGISEITAWLKNSNNKIKGTKPAYFMPNLASPDRAESDVIKTGLDPIVQAFLFGNQSRSGKISGNNIYEMVATSIFAQINQNDIHRTQINEGFKRLGSIGTSQYYVPATDLQSEFRDLVRQRVPESLKKATQADSLKENEVLRRLTPLFEAASQSDKNTVMGVIYGALQPAFASFKKELTAKLESNKPADAIAYVTQYNKLPDGVLEKAVQQGVNKITLTDNQNISLLNAIRLNIVKDVENLSIAGVGLIINAYMNCLGQYERVIQTLGTAPKSELAQYINTCLKEGDGLFGLGKKINSEEKDLILQQSDVFLRSLVSTKPEKNIGSVLKKEMNAIIDALKSWKHSYEEIIGTFKTSKPENINADALPYILVSKDHPFSPKTNLGGQRLVSRVLKPILNDQRLEEIIEATKSESEDYKKYVLELNKTIKLACIGSKTEESPKGCTADLQNQIKQKIKKIQEEVNVDHFKLEENFEFREVVNTLVNEWVSLLNSEKVQQDRTRQDDLNNQFKRIFGMPLVRITGDDKRTFLKPDLDTVLVSMGEDLCQTCDPLLDYKKADSAIVDQVKLFLPKSNNEAHDKSWEDIGQKIAAKEINDVKISVDSKRTSSSPFLMLAHTTCWVNYGSSSNNDTHLDDIKTLDYRNLPEVNRWLIGAEDKGGASYFNLSEFGAGTYGFGYISPRFVKDPVWSEMRWKPWAKLAIDKEAEAERLHTDALAWALVSYSPDFAESLDDSAGNAVRNEYKNMSADTDVDIQEIGNSLNRLATKHPGLALKPFLMGPGRSGEARWVINRNLLTNRNKKIVEGTDRESEPLKLKSYDSLLAILEEMKKDPSIAKRILDEKELVKSTFDYAKIERFLASCVVRNLTEELKRVESIPQRKMHVPVATEILAAATRWRDSCPEAE